tara:strand:- start:1847 stop:2365 length:519 start_codon:yes stop_codon:yes gene_type:complete
MSSNKDDEPKMILVNKLDPMSEFIPFGRYLLSLKQLQKNRFMLRTKARNPVLSFRTIVLTRRTKAIVQNLLRQNPISYEDIDALDQEEKEQIDTIVSKTDITDRLKIPNTKRSRLERDLHKFNVLRGSIIAGGDNVSMLKDFRRLLLHLTNENYISKKECNEVLMEMLKLNI